MLEPEAYLKVQLKLNLICNYGEVYGFILYLMHSWIIGSYHKRGFIKILKLVSVCIFRIFVRYENICSKLIRFDYKYLIKKPSTTHILSLFLER